MEVDGSAAVASVVPALCAVQSPPPHDLGSSVDAPILSESSKRILAQELDAATSPNRSHDSLPSSQITSLDSLTKATSYDPSRASTTGQLDFPMSTVEPAAALSCTPSSFVAQPPNTMEPPVVHPCTEAPPVFHPGGWVQRLNELERRVGDVTRHLSITNSPSTKAVNSTGDSIIHVMNKLDEMDGAVKVMERKTDQFDTGLVTVKLEALEKMLKLSERRTQLVGSEIEKVKCQFLTEISVLNGKLDVIEREVGRLGMIIQGPRLPADGAEQIFNGQSA